MSLLNLSSKEEEIFISKTLSSSPEFSIESFIHVGAKKSLGKWWWTADEKRFNWTDLNAPNSTKYCLSAGFDSDHNVTFKAIDCDEDELEFICEKRESLRTFRKLKQIHEQSQ